MAPASEKKHLDVETDGQKLVNYVCGANIYKEGVDPKLKPDSEYPEWLWTLRMDRGPVPLEELDKDSWQYWQRLQSLEKKRISKFSASRHKYKQFGKPKVPLE